MNIKKKVAKKAYKQIQHIKKAHNMLEVESAINTAIAETFGMNNHGAIKIAMRENYTELLKEYGATSYGGNFELLKSIRNFNCDTYKEEAKQFLITLIPERMKVTAMYKKLYV